MDVVKSVVLPPAKSEAASLSVTPVKSNSARLALLIATVNKPGAAWTSLDIQGWLERNSVPDAALIASSRALKHGGILQLYAESVLDGRDGSACVDEFYKLFRVPESLIPSQSVVDLVTAIKQAPL